MADEKGYQGWGSWEAWNLNLVLTNEYDFDKSLNVLRQQAARAVENCTYDPDKLEERLRKDLMPTFMVELKGMLEGESDFGSESDEMFLKTFPKEAFDEVAVALRESVEEDVVFGLTHNGKVEQQNQCTLDFLKKHVPPTWKAEQAFIAAVEKALKEGSG